jgi:hypothetical protein
VALWLMPLATSLVASPAATALACPDCWVGRAARTEVWSDSFALYLGLGLVPFAVSAAVCLLIETRGKVP